MENDNAPMLPMPIKVKPYAHQITAYNFVCKKLGLLPESMYSSTGYGAALLMEMGTGKTLTTIAVEGALYNAGRIRRVLVVSPLSVTGVWKDEHDSYADFDYTLAVLKGSGEKKLDTLRHMTGQPLQAVVVNYESAWRLEKELAAWKPDLIIADEGHKIKTHNISASKAMHRLGAVVKYRLLLTGTPVTNKAIDIFSQYKFLDPRIFGQSFYSFRNQFFFMTGYGNHTPVLKKSMEDEITRRMHSIAFRATKKECLDLPETTDIIRKVELEPKAIKLYQSLVKESYAELSDGEITITNVLTKLLRLSQLTGGFIGSDESSVAEQVSTAKLDVLEDIVDSALEENQKLVIIARFVPELNAIGKLLKEQTFNEDNNFEETTLQLNLQEILRFAEVENFFVGESTKTWKLRFEPDVSILDGIKRVISLLDGWKVDETANGVIGVAAVTDARFDQPAVYTFEHEKTCWSYSVEYDDSEAVSKVCVTCADPESTVYATVPRNKWWVQPSHRTTYVTAADGATLTEITAMAEELAQAIAISGRQESFVGIFTPQLTIGDEVRIVSGAKTETIGTVTDVTHNFGRGGFYTAFTVDSGGRKGKARLSDLIGKASEKPNLNGVTIY